VTHRGPFQLLPCCDSVVLYLFISHRILNQAENLFMGSWAQLSPRAAAALRGPYVHSTMLRDSVSTLSASRREAFVQFILFLVQSTQNELQLWIAGLSPEHCMLGFLGVGLLFAHVWIKRVCKRDVVLCVCAVL